MQKKVGNALYVFDTTPFTITADTDAEVIYVQQEYLKGYLELNTELESKIKTFNQWLLCVNAPWADSGTPGPGPGPEPTPDYHLLTLSDVNNIYIAGYNFEQLPGEYSNDWFSVINTAQRNAGMINSDEGNKIYCNAGAKVFIWQEPSDFETMTGLELIQTDGGEKYGFVMGDSDMTVDFSYTLKPKYHVNFTGDSNAPADVQIDPQEQIAGNNVYIRFLNGQSSNTIAVTSNDVELTYEPNMGEYYFTMPANDVNIKAVYAQPYNINFTEDSNAQADVQIDPQQTVAGHDVYIRFLHNQSSSAIAVTSNDVQLTYDQPNDQYYFTMPEKDVNIKAVYTQSVYNINLTEDSNATADVKIVPQRTVAGNKVNIQFLNGQSSSTVEVTSNDVQLKYNPKNDKYNFTMPANDVNIKAVYKQPIQISLDLGGTDLTCASYEPSGTYYPHASFVVQAPEGKTTDNYTFVKSDEENIVVNPVGDHFNVEFKVSGTVTFANA